ncbi:putative transmembrane protein [Toxoplasma gondii RUB]|uniref:Transmembrane protein n=6 Tax=Toxoplasma gondii TaxID=5811 RepID=S7V333_TOXGG|nr:hypothetical protein TGGT1_232950 [Toxoplasma gondii GT1]KFG48770.1 putative transmembrane protein [Toxoplasma gondii GAB2-2007-GAL-DOM2]KFG55270.1 putative transmembrane protein [Toxoplasma gondii FOU]KFG63834.1 putative transmembrane protein [Toxoplasma gondii RUB]KFH17282.1 putative transmembrane protein [Toxoplasma gondii MAS]PUA92591.1 putative transmembrane protein [Toxoplasma gondii TgCATBr9]
MMATVKEDISLFILIVFSVNLQVRASEVPAEAWEDLRPVGACIRVDRLYSKFNTDLCATIGLLPCTSVALTTFQFRRGLIAEAPDPSRCFKLLSNFQAAFTCEYKHLKQFMLYEISSGNVYIDACTDTCREMWQACSPRSTSDYVYLLEEPDTQRFCNSLALPERGVFVRYSNQPACLSVADFLQEAGDGSSISSSYTATLEWIGSIARFVILITLIVSLAAAFTYAIGQNAGWQLKYLFSSSTPCGGRSLYDNNIQDGGKTTEFDLL